MNSIAKVFNNFKEFYSEINGATLTGAIDVIIVEQPDGSFVCSPFHVRFGKLGVLRSREKIVDIEINGEPVDIHMKLGESGEAFFVEECLEEDGEVPAHMATSPIPTSSFIEFARDTSIVTVTQNLEDENIPRPRRNSIDLSKENTESDKSKFENQKSDFNHRRHTDNTTGRPDLTLTKKEYTTQKIRQEWAEAEQEQIFQMDGIENSTTDWQNSTLLPPNNEEDKHFKPIETVPTSTESKLTNSELASQEDQQAQLLEDKTNADSKSKKKRRKRSIMKKKNSQRKNSSSSSGGSNHSDPNDGVETDSITASQPTASSASGSPKEGEPENLTATPAENAPKEIPELSNRGHELDIHFFSDTEVTAGVSPRQSRPSTPIQSDTEFEISQRENVEGDSMSASWKWGELPTKPEEIEDLSTSQGKQAQRNSMLSGLMSFMKYNNKKMRKNVPDGLYLSDLDESLDPEVAALYFPPVSSKAQHAQTEEDRESGNGTSLPHSPTSLEGVKSLDSDFDDNKDKLSLDFIALSLCGGLDRGTPTYEEFEKHRLQYADVCNSPTIFSSPDLVVRINDKYCSWQTACPQVMTMLAFQKSLPTEQAETPSKPKSLDVATAGSVEADAQSTKQQVSQTASEANRGGRWWYWRRSNDKSTMKTENETEQQSKTSAIATQTSRSNTPEDVGTMTESFSKTKEDGYNGSLSSEDSELPSDQPTNQELILNKSDSFIEKYRKTLRLSSEQIESLNLNDGMNEIVFSVTTAYQGTTRCKCYLFKWRYNDKVVISDIDGTITKSDVLGHILPMVGRNWEQIGVAQLFSKIEENGYKMLYLSARAIGQAKTTRDYLQSIRQGDVKLPDGPLLLNPTSLMSAFHREVIEKKPEQFKIACLSDIQALFPDKNPFYAGYGNRINDVWAYRAVGIPISRIFTINTKGELKHELTQTFQSTRRRNSILFRIMDPLQLGTSGRAQKRRSEQKRTLQEIALQFIDRDGNSGSCRIDPKSGCTYVQVTCDIGNFVRHFRTQHADAARRNGLFKEQDTVAKKPRTIAKRLIAIDKRLLFESLAKCVCYHNLPLSCIEWEGLKQLIDPIAVAVGVSLNRNKNKAFIHAIATRVRTALSSEMKHKLLSLKVDSASRYHRHVLGINVQFVLDGKFVIRTLGMVEIRERQTAAFLKTKILDVLQSYGVSLDQIFSVTVDNGANMVAAVNGLKHEFDVLITQQMLSEDGGECESKMVDEIDNEADIENAALESQEISDSLSAEFQEQLNLVRCAVHTLQLAVLDVVDKKDESVRQITELAKKCKNVKYNMHFDRSDSTIPPVWAPTRWGGIFKMLNSFHRQKEFYVQLGLQFPELEVTSKNWEFIEHYVQAFEPLDICTKKLQERHVSLSDFYIAWLKTINAVRNMFSNPFAQKLTKALTDRLIKLKMSQAFQMALYMDPRLNYLNSKLFNDEEKLHVQACIKDTWNRIRKLQPSSGPGISTEKNANVNSQFDDFVTELYGGTLSKTDNEATDSSFAQQLKALDAEPRQDHTYDVFKHWLKRRETHPELFEVAMVVLATPSNQVSVERAFSALALILTSHRVGLGPDALEDILIIKLNRDIFEKETDSIDWDDIVNNIYS